MNFFSRSTQGYDKFEGLDPAKVGKLFGVNPGDIINMSYLLGNILVFTRDNKTHKKQVSDISKYKR